MSIDFNNSFENSAKLSNSELNALRSLANNPEQLENADHDSLKTLRDSIKSEVDAYKERTQNSSYIEGLASKIFNKIDSIVSDGSSSNLIQEASFNSGSLGYNKMGGTSTSKLDLSNMPKFETTEDGKGHDWMSSLAGKTHGETSTGKVQVSSLDRSTETTDKFGEAQFQALTQEHINGPNTLKSACSRLGIDPRELQEHLGVKVDGLIGGGTYRAFNNLRGGTDNIISSKKVENVDGLANKEYLEALDLPKNFQVIGAKFLNKLPNNEVLRPKDPIALVDGNSKQMCYIIDGEVKIANIILGEKGLTYGEYVPYDRKTPAGMVHEFNPNISKMALSPDGNASNGGSDTVISASLQSPHSVLYGGRYFHGVEDHRLPVGGTWGCIGVDKNFIRDMYADVEKNGRGFGYTDTA